jgi:hypothetical protein
VWQRFSLAPAWQPSGQLKNSSGSVRFHFAKRRLGFLGIVVLLMMWAVLAVVFLQPVNSSLAHANDSLHKDAHSSVAHAVLSLFQSLVAGDS